MAHAPTVTVVVPTYRGWPVLETCLQSLHGQRYDAVEVIVVDDGSRDRTPERVREAFPAFRVVELPENRGFAAAVNEGIRVSEGQIVALLNNDTSADPDWLSALVQTFVSDSTIGFCASRMVRADAPAILDGAGDEYSRYGLAYRVGRGLRDTGQFEAREILWASGGACAYRRDVFAQVGPLDERLGSYYEDVDLGLRASSAGWRGRYVPESIVRHIGHWSQPSDRVTFLTTRNSLLLLWKHWPTSLLVRYLPYLVYGQLRGAGWALREGHFRAWWAGVRAAIQMARTIPRCGHRKASWHRRLAPAYPFGGKVGLPGTRRLN